MAAIGGYLSGQSAVCSSTNNQFVNRSLYNEKHRPRRVVHYEKEFNINTSRISPEDGDLRDSMLAYSRHMENIKERSQMIPTDVSSLHVRARNIPKTRTLPKLGIAPSKASVRSKHLSQNYPGAKESRSPTKLSEVSVSDSNPEKPSIWHSKPNHPRKEELRMNYASDVDIEEMKKDKTRRTRAAVHINAPTSHLQAWATEKNRRKPSEHVGSKAPSSRAAKSVELRHRFCHVAQPTETSSNESIASTYESKHGEDDGEIQRKREEATKIILQDAIDKLKEIDNRSKCPKQLIARLKGNRLKNRRLQLNRQKLDAIPEDDDGSGGHTFRSGVSNAPDPVRFSLSREQPIDTFLNNGGGSKQNYMEMQMDNEVGLTGFVPDTSMFPKRTFALPPLSSKPAPYQEYVPGVNTKRLQQRARQRQRARKLKFLRD